MVTLFGIMLKVTKSPNNKCTLPFHLIQPLDFLVVTFTNGFCIKQIIPMIG